MGTAGAVAKCADQLDCPEGSHIFVVNGDVMSEFPLQMMLDQHIQTRKLCTIMTKKAQERMLQGQDISSFG